MKIKDILAYSSADDIVKKIEATREKTSTTIAKENKKEWDVSQHRTIVDKEFLPDKEIKDKKGNVIKTKHVNRIVLPFQKMIVERTIAFGFSNDVELEVKKPETNNNSGDDLVNAVKKVLYENKITTFNKKIARDLYRNKEVAEIWYVKKEPESHERYGFKTEYSIGVSHISGWTDDNLYPIFDGYNKLQLFARGYVENVLGEKLSTYEVWSDEEYIKVQKKTSGWTIIEQKPNPFRKIPIVIGTQETNEWEDVKYEIERLELLLSRHAEINDYHASPKTFVKGNLKSMPQAGESNGVLNGEEGSDAKILSWNSAPESIKLEIETRLENIHKFTQIPDISFKSVKALNQVSGVMLKMLFMDAHLKVMAKNEIWDEYFTRRFNIIKEMLAYLNPSSSWNTDKNTIEITPIIRPFMIQDTKEQVDIAITANGGKAILDRQGAIEFVGLTTDSESVLNKILKEEQDEFYQSSSEPQDY